MLSVKPNKEIFKIKNTMFQGFTGGQFFAGIIALVVGVIVFNILPFPIFIKPFFMLAAMGVILIPAFFKYDGMNFFQFIWAIIRTGTSKPLLMENDKWEVELSGTGHRKKRFGKGKKIESMSGYYSGGEDI